MTSHKLLAPVCTPNVRDGTLGEAMRFVSGLELGIWADESRVRSHAALMMAGEFAAMGIAIHPLAITGTMAFREGFEAARGGDRDRIRRGVESITGRSSAAEPRTEKLDPADVTRAVLRELNGYRGGDVQVAIAEVIVRTERRREWRCLILSGGSMSQPVLDEMAFDNRGEAEARRAALVYALGFTATDVECLQPIIVDAWAEI